MNNFCDFSNVKPDIRECIPGGIPLYVEFRFAPGGAGTDGALTQSQTTDAKYLKAEFTVLRGPYRGRKFWSNMTVEGGKVDEKGNSIAAGITRKTMRLMIDSSRGLSSKDDSPDASAKRVLTGFKDLQGLRFVCVSKIEKGKDGYPDKNTLGEVLTIDSKKYPKSDADIDNPALPGNSAAAAPPAPVWGAPAQPTQAATPASQPTTQAFAPAPQAVAQAPEPAPVVAPQPAPTQDTGALPAWFKPAA